MVTLTGDNAYVAAVAMRIPALIAVGLMVWAVPRLAERLGVSRDRAMWLGVLNPLVMMHLVGGAHGDALMIAFVAVALLLACRGQLVLASMSVAVAASFKQTAVLALIGVIGMAMQADHPPHRSKLASLVRASLLYGLISAATFSLITAATGLGWGWIANLSVPVSLRSLLSPSTLVGSTVEGLMRVSGLPASLVSKPLPIAQGHRPGDRRRRDRLRSPGGLAPRKPVLAAGLALLVLCATGPVVHPWYLLWGGVVLAATRLGRRSTEVMIWVTLFLVTYGVVDATMANGTWALGVTVAVWMLVRMLLQRRGGDTNDPTDLLELNRDLRATSRQRSSSSALG